MSSDYTVLKVGEEAILMHALISEKLRNHLQRVGSAVLTVTLEPLRC
jgi:hypothetical protein